MTAAGLESKLRAAASLKEVVHVSAVDESDGCGSKFSVTVVSSAFEGMPLLKRHRTVNSVLEEEIPKIHALQLKTPVPAEWPPAESKA